MPDKTTPKYKYCAALAVLVFLVLGMVFAPRPGADISARIVLENAIKASQDIPGIPLDLIRSEMDDDCTPILAGQSRVNNSTTWAIRLKPSNRRYPWISVWIDQTNNQIVAWKRWDRPGRRAKVTRQSSAPESPYANRPHIDCLGLSVTGK